MMFINILGLATLIMFIYVMIFPPKNQQYKGWLIGITITLIIVELILINVL